MTEIIALWQDFLNFFVVENLGFFYNVFCSGGINEEDPWNEKDNRENAIMAFFRDHFAVALNKTYVKILVLWLFLGYLFVSGWAVSNLKEGLERKRLSRDDSYSVPFYNMDEKYFREYPYRVNVSWAVMVHRTSTHIQMAMLLTKMITIFEVYFHVHHVIEIFHFRWLLVANTIILIRRSKMIY